MYCPFVAVPGFHRTPGLPPVFNEEDIPFRILCDRDRTCGETRSSVPSSIRQRSDSTMRRKLRGPECRAIVAALEPIIKLLLFPTVMAQG